MIGSREDTSVLEGEAPISRGQPAGEFAVVTPKVEAGKVNGRKKKERKGKERKGKAMN